MHELRDEALLLQRLGEMHRTLFSTLQICRACGQLSMAESERLRDALFALSAQFRLPGEGVPEQEIVLCQNAAQALSHAALCLMSGPHDCPQWCSVDARKLAACVDELGNVHNALEQASTVTPLD
ncbi:biofilm formation regulator BssR [Enterobacteriaceae bacterium 4M9]|nr:biofilm formation regulator BssR [Enterobacteriaceae bacterium 4M9]